MRKPFGRVGSKTYIANEIIERTLKNVSFHGKPYTELTYVEPFSGGAGIFWKKKPSSLEVLNDIDERLIEGYKMLKTVEMTKEEIEKYENMNLKELNALYSSKTRNKNDIFVNTILYTCGTYGCSGRGKIYRKGGLNKKLNKLNVYKKRISNCIFTVGDYKNTIKKYDNENTIFYLDPPYENSKRLYTNYLIDLNELRDILKEVKGFFILSLNDSENTREIFKDFHVNTIIQKKRNSGSCLGKEDRTELLITNYEIQ